jgi:putative oxidoreductase
MPRLPGLQRGWGIAVVRVMMGIILLIAGYQKFAGGVGAVAAGFEKIPIPLPWLAAVFISTLELVGGALLIVGLGVRWLGLAFALEHVVTTEYLPVPAGDGWWQMVPIWEPNQVANPLRRYAPPESR